MAKQIKLNRKQFSEIADVNTYGRGRNPDYGKQFIIGYKWTEILDENGKIINSGFTYLFYGYGKKSILEKNVLKIINTMSDEEIKNLSFVASMTEMPLSCRAPFGLDCRQ